MAKTTRNSTKNPTGGTDVLTNDSVWFQIGLYPDVVDTLSGKVGADDSWLSVTHYDPDFKEAVIEDIQSLGSLLPNWDGYGSPAIDRAVIDAAVRFIRRLPENIAYRPRVVPMSSGRLQFEWRHGKKSLELEFESPSNICFLQWDSQHGIENEGSIRVDELDRAIDLIRWFMCGTTL